MYNAQVNTLGEDNAKFSVGFLRLAVLLRKSQKILKNELTCFTVICTA